MPTESTDPTTLKQQLKDAKNQLALVMQQRDAALSYQKQAAGELHQMRLEKLQIQIQLERLQGLRPPASPKSVAAQGEAEATAKATELAQLRSECELVTARCGKLEAQNKHIGEENRLLNLHAQRCCVRYNGGQEEQTQPSEDCMDKCNRLEVENLQLLEATNSLQTEVAADEAASGSWKSKCNKLEVENLQLLEATNSLQTKVAADEAASGSWKTKCSERELELQAVNTALSESTQRVLEADNNEQQLASCRELLRKRDESDVAALRFHRETRKTSCSQSPVKEEPTTDPYFDPLSFQKELDFHVENADAVKTGKGRLFGRWR